MHLDTKIHPDTSILEQIIVVGGSFFFWTAGLHPWAKLDFCTTPLFCASCMVFYLFCQCSIHARKRNGWAVPRRSSTGAKNEQGIHMRNLAWDLPASDLMKTPIAHMRLERSENSSNLSPRTSHQTDHQVLNRASFHAPWFGPSGNFDSVETTTSAPPARLQSPHLTVCLIQCTGDWCTATHYRALALRQNSRRIDFVTTFVSF
jgi:hypothetical protein